MSTDLYTPPNRASAGTAAAPGASIGAVTDGIYQISAGNLGFTFGGVEGFRGSVNGIGIGIDADSSSRINVYASGTAVIELSSDANAVIRHTTYVSSSTVGGVITRKARGTKASPAAPAQNDSITRWRGQAWTTGTTFVDVGELTLVVTAATPSATDLQGRLVGLLCPAASVTNTEIFRFEHATGFSMFGANPVIDQNRLLRLRVYTVATLPTAVEGALAYVTDATLTVITGLGLAPTGGGTNRVPVYADNVGWKII